MYFFVDESGNTGANLFDESQPILYYGILHAKTNLDITAERYVKEARSRLGIERIHANEIGLGGLVKILDLLLKIQKQYEPRFDLYRINKPDLAAICFFDQVFDQGLNPAMTWMGYWTPQKYVLLIKVSSLFDEDTLKLAWKTRIETNDSIAEKNLQSVCSTLLSRIHELPDARSKQLIGDVLTWAIKNPDKLWYNCKSKKEVLSVTPNIIGFQSVMQGIAMRIKDSKGARCITVDRQSEFNQAQKTLAEYFANVRGVSLPVGPGLPELDFSKIPEVPITFRSSSDSVGLELVDVYLWIFKRLFEKKELAEELKPLIKFQWRRGYMDEVSLDAIERRWSKWLDELPEPTEEQIKKGQELLDLDEGRRWKSSSE